jgi:hypothetical protein
LAAQPSQKIGNRVTDEKAKNGNVYGNSYGSNQNATVQGFSEEMIIMFPAELALEQEAFWKQLDQRIQIEQDQQDQERPGEYEGLNE